MSYEPRCCGQDGWQEINSAIDEFHSLRSKYILAQSLYYATTVCVETLNLKFCGWGEWWLRSFFRKNSSDMRVESLKYLESS